MRPREQRMQTDKAKESTGTHTVARSTRSRCDIQFWHDQGFLERQHVLSFHRLMNRPLASGHSNWDAGHRKWPTFTYALIFSFAEPAGGKRGKDEASPLQRSKIYCWCPCSRPSPCDSRPGSHVTNVRRERDRCRSSRACVLSPSTRRLILLCLKFH